jgi:hypothetical protein
MMGHRLLIMAQPPAFVHTLPHYNLKLERSAYDATQNNPKENEAPYYEVWDLWLNDLILHQADYSLRPQGVLSVYVSPRQQKKTQKSSIAKRTPDFIIYHNRDTEIDGNYSRQRDVAFIAEVKPWEKGMTEDRSMLVREFNDREFLDQVRDHAKMIMIQHHKARVWLVQCVGLFWRAGSLRNESISPFSNRAPTGKNVPREHAEHIEWGPIEKVGDVASDIQQAGFWSKVSYDVE